MKRKTEKKVEFVVYIYSVCHHHVGAKSAVKLSTGEVGVGAQ